MEMDTYCWSALILFLFIFVRGVEFRDLVLRGRSSWPRCLLWHGWLPALACNGGASPWASAEDIACARLERLLGSDSVLGVSSSPFAHIRESPEFHDLLSLDRRIWPWCLLWHGGLLLPDLVGLLLGESIAEARPESAFVCLP